MVHGDFFALYAREKVPIDTPFRHAVYIMASYTKDKSLDKINNKVNLCKHT